MRILSPEQYLTLIVSSKLEVDKIPKGHVRKREVAEYDIRKQKINKIEDNKEFKFQKNEQYNLIIRKSVNLGTSKYKYYIDKIETESIEYIDESDCYIKTKEKRINKNNILGVIQ